MSKPKFTPVPPDASASPRNFALSRSCDLPRVCRICGAPALPKECNNGLICRECYNKHRREQQYHKRHELTERMAKTCKYCGAPAMGGGRAQSAGSATTSVRMKDTRISAPENMSRAAFAEQ